MEIKMEGIKAANTPGMGGNDIDMSEGVPKMKGTKKKNKKRRGQNRKLGIKFQIKKQEQVSLNINKKWDHAKKPAEKRKVEEPEQSETMEDKTDDQDPSPQRPKKGKKRNNRNYRYDSPMMELTTTLHQETKGRTSHRDERTLYVRFPPSLSVREKSYVQPLVPTAVDIRFPRLSPGNFAKYCYIEFETEEEASVMKDKIEKIEVNGEAFYADYVGKKSKAYNEKEARTIDPLRLYVGGLPKGIQTSHIRHIFPTASQVLYRRASHKVSQSHAYIMFKTHEEALKVFHGTRDLKMQGKDVIVMFATYKSGNQLKENEDQSAIAANKKQKTEAM